MQSHWAYKRQFVLFVMPSICDLAPRAGCTDPVRSGLKSCQKLSHCSGSSDPPEGENNWKEDGPADGCIGIHQASSLFLESFIEGTTCSVVALVLLRWQGCSAALAMLANAARTITAITTVPPAKAISGLLFIGSEILARG